MQVLASLFSAAELNFESEHALEVALQLYREESADFAVGRRRILRPMLGSALSGFSRNG